MTTDIPSQSLALPAFSPLKARLLNALVCRALPLSVALDAGTASQVVCRLSINGTAASREHEPPCTPAATLFLRSGDGLWRLEWSSLEALALRPELADWRRSQPVECQNFSLLPQELCLAVLERLLTPALARLGDLLGCDVRCTATPADDPGWEGPLPLVLRLPDGQAIFLRLFWAEESAARMLLEQMERLPLHRVRPPRLAESFACPLEAGSMHLSVQEVRELDTGDVLLPEVWTMDMPRLRLPRGRALACRLAEGILSVLGPDAGTPDGDHAENTSEEGMNEAQNAAPAEDAQEQAVAEEPLMESTALDSLELSVVFEIGRLHLRLDELASLTPGHTFALGGSACSPVVDVRVAGRVLAQGRLVDVGGMPGVQITRILQGTQDADREAGEPASASGDRQEDQDGNGRH